MPGARTGVLSESTDKKRMLRHGVSGWADWSPARPGDFRVTKFLERTDFTCLNNGLIKVR